MKKYSVNKIGSNIKSRRQKLKLTREELAGRARVNYNTIIKLESGANKNPTVRTLLGLASVFKTNVDDLIS